MPCSGAHGQCLLGELAPLRTEWSVGDLNWPPSGSASQINRLKNILVAKHLNRSNAVTQFGLDEKTSLSGLGENFVFLAQNTCYSSKANLLYVRNI